MIQAKLQPIQWATLTYTNVTVLYTLSDLGFNLYKGNKRNSQFPQDEEFTIQISKLKPKHEKRTVRETEKCQFILWFPPLTNFDSSHTGSNVKKQYQ